MADPLMPSYLHACAVGGRHIFLDLQRDRYFRLPDAEGATFAALLQADASPTPSALEALVRLGVLTNAADGKAVGLTRHPRPDASLWETLDVGGRPWTWLRDLIETTALVQGARRIVTRKKLPAALARIAAARGPGPRRHDPELRDRLVRRFLAVRPFVPLPARCLHDTLALSRFLARRGVFPDIVVGVKLHPFGAHCWLQDGTLVLNDTLGSARDYQPVLVG
jgi:hypothetical protein